jgi:hypothetical protein
LPIAVATQLILAKPTQGQALRHLQFVTKAQMNSIKSAIDRAPCCKDALRRTRYLFFRSFQLLLVLSLFYLTACSLSTEKRKIAQTKQTIQQLASEVDMLRRKSGRLPRDEAEFTSLRGKPLPTSAWGRQIEYRLDKDSPENFWIITLSPAPQGWIFRYGSKHPEAGITVVLF